MDSETFQSHLSEIPTLWTLVRGAHADDSKRGQAQRQLLDRYGGAIKRYLLGALRDADAADELFQDFAYRLLHGDLRGADPERGKFRAFVKGVLFHLVCDYHKRKQRLPRDLSDNAEPAVEAPSLLDVDREFLSSWRDEILARSWQALEAHEQKTGQPFYTVLRFRVDHAELASQGLADRLSEKLGKKITAGSIRQTLHRARERFADLVLDEVVQSLEQPSAEQMEQELIDLGLLEYCRPALERRGE